MKPALLGGAAIGLLASAIVAASAQQAADAPATAAPLPMLFSTSPPAAGPIGQLPSKFELPAALPAIPSGVAIIPPAEGQVQRAQGQAAPNPPGGAPAAAPVTVVPVGAAPPAPAPYAPLPTTTPMPPAEVATPLVPPTIPPIQAARPGQPAAPPLSARPPQPAVPPASAQPALPVASPGGARSLPAPAGRPEMRAAQPSTVAYPMFAAAADSRQQVIRLRDMGRVDDVHLEGTLAEVSVPFTTRQDDAFVGSRISLIYSYSSAVARDDGELAVYLNDEFVGSVPLGKSRGPSSRAEFTFSPTLLTTDNRLQFRFALKGQGANACKVARDKAYWVNVEPASFIYLSTTRLPLPDDLAFLPRPFVDPKDPLPVSLPFVLPPSPEPGVMQAAGMIAGYFGLMAQYKGATFPVVFNGIPASNAVVVVQGDRYPPGLVSIPGEGPRVAVITNPLQIDSKLLLVIGANAEELQTAAATLALGVSHLAGGWSVARAPPAPLRKPYDAPKWVSTKYPIPLGDLVGAFALSGRRIADAPQVSFRTAPDLFFGALSGGNLYLRIRRADDTWMDVGNSRVVVNLNQRVAGEVPMDPRLKVLSRLKEWLFPGKADERVSQVLLPGYQLFSANRLDFLFDLRANQNADCTSLDWSDRTGIDPASTIDLTRVAHFAALPNLALFANAGFPFTRLADLSDTAFVISDGPSAEEAETFLNLLGKFADATGVAATRYAVVTAGRVDTMADRNLIIIGLDSSEPLLRQWASYNSIRIASGGVTATPQPNFLLRLFQPFDPRAPYADGTALELARASFGKPYAFLSSYWSPLNANRIVVAVGGNQGPALVDLTKQMEDPELVAKIQGDFFFLSDGKGEFYSSGRRKFIGELPLWWRIQWVAGSYGLAAFGGIIGATLIFAMTIQRFAAHRASRLLARRLPNRVGESPGLADR